MKVSSRVRYGCRTVLDLLAREEGGPVALESMAQSQDLPEHYLSKIAQDLRRAGILQSVRGAHGGYEVDASSEELSVLDIWTALDGPITLVDCIDDPGACECSEDCVMREVWTRVRVGLEDLLRRELLAVLAQEHRQRGGCCGD